ncbi:hypothetical protein MNBD_NITROSPINAE04-2249 [hydrothermal vent metagenome]|uniref:Uncharacterized protein n=1 Tax=hydrothermal vent metagenome TaxID=652676 RepID=A0A3B1CWY4_9ZZZZ
MTKNFWVKLDSLLFRIAGAVLGLSGCMGLLLNNPFKVLISNAYGVVFFLIFAILGSYSTFSIIKELIAPEQSLSE